MNMGFQEKSIWVSMIATIVIFGVYFLLAFMVFTHPPQPDTNLPGLFVLMVALYIIIQIVLQSALAIYHRKETEADERDKLIELKASRISHFILVFGVWISGGLMFIYPAPIMANVLLLFFIITELVGFAMQLIYYRRGV